MPIDLRMPSINGATEKEQLAQIRSYLYQFVPQLQWALSNVDTVAQGYVAQQSAKGNGSVTSNNATMDALETFNAIKSLIIKSADIVAAYYDEIRTRLDGAYVAVSDFGTYAEKTSQVITANSTEIRQDFYDTHVIVIGLIDSLYDVSDELVGINGKVDEVNGALTDANDDIGTIKNAVDTFDGSLKDISDELDKLNGLINETNALVVKTRARIISGILYYSKDGKEHEDEVDGGLPIYGIEVGQNVRVNDEEIFNKFARFTSDRLSFYDKSGTEVAYVSDKKLYISSVEITSEGDFDIPAYKEGGYADYVTAGGGIVTKWVGGNG